MRRKYIYGCLLILALIALAGCGLNPLIPSLEELRNDKNYLPLHASSSWSFESAAGETLTWTVTAQFTTSSRNVFTVIQNTAENTTTYYMSPDSRGVDFCNLGIFNPFIRYPMIEGFTWEYSGGIDYNYFIVQEVGVEIKQWEETVYLEWEVYWTFPEISYDYSKYFHLADGIGPVSIQEGEIIYYLKDFN